MDPGLSRILALAPSAEIDYGFVLDCLKGYKNPRVKINQLLKLGALIRVKKGIYILGLEYAKKPYSPEVLANIIYGPSYVSLEWACQYYRLIPEAVRTVTSVTTKRTKHFETPIGLFTYDHVPLKLYRFGFKSVALSDTQSALMASKEKAMIDLLVIRRGKIASKKQLQEILYDDFRIEPDEIEGLDSRVIKEAYLSYPHSAIHYLLEVIRE